MTRQKIGSIV
jgi:hypothetical protein